MGFKQSKSMYKQAIQSMKSCLHTLTSCPLAIQSEYFSEAWWRREEEYAAIADPVMPNECLANPALFFVTNHTVQKNPIQPVVMRAAMIAEKVAVEITITATDNAPM